jgi:guanylate kinase
VDYVTSARKVPEVDRAFASARAVAARRARAALKQDLRTRVVRAQDALEQALADVDSPAGSMRVTDFLGALPAIGVTKRDRILEQLGISPVKRLGGLGIRQREILRKWLDERFPMPQPRENRSGLIVLAGPTAVGKGTVARYIREHYPSVHLSISATTRPPRPGEIEGVHYYFVDDAEFDRLVQDGELLEWALVHGKYRYGTPKAPVETALALGQTALLEIDIQGARQVVKTAPEATLVFLLPPSWDALIERLASRGTEDAEERTRRLRTAKIELAAQDEFDYRVVNDEVARAAAEVANLAA